MCALRSDFWLFFSFAFASCVSFFLSILIYRFDQMRLIIIGLLLFIVNEYVCQTKLRPTIEPQIEKTFSEQMNTFLPEKFSCLSQISFSLCLALLFSFLGWAFKWWKYSEHILILILRNKHFENLGTIRRMKRPFYCALHLSKKEYSNIFRVTALKYFVCLSQYNWKWNGTFVHSYRFLFYFAELSSVVFQLVTERIFLQKKKNGSLKKVSPLLW